jgi:hypothetical protein
VYKLYTTFVGKRLSFSTSDVKGEIKAKTQKSVVISGDGNGGTRSEEGMEEEEEEEEEEECVCVLRRKHNVT